MLLSIPCQAVEISEIRVWSKTDTTRVAINLSEPSKYRLFTLANPERVVIDIPKAQSRQPLGRPALQDPLIVRIRAALRENNEIRLVMDLHQAAAVKSTISPVKGQQGYRLVVELAKQRSQSMPPALLGDPPPPKGPAAPERLSAGQTGKRTGQKRSLKPEDNREGLPSKSLSAVASQTALEKVRPAPASLAGHELVIAIDAGHGGEDPGARGAKGTQEKDITLEIARRLAALVHQEAGMRPLMIRNRDRYIGLRERMSKARAHKVDLFISIHADAFEDRGVGGSSVYVLSEHGASSEAAHMLAARENAADLIGDISLEDKNTLLKSVLIDLSQKAVLDASIDVAGQVLDNLNQVAKIHKRDIQRAGFMVLKSPDIPSLLVETAYITNPREEQKLINPRHQQALAEAMMKGIRAYFRQSAPNGALFVAR
jgi:N-acetylmuramoyl-L-alanine amidase